MMVHIVTAGLSGVTENYVSYKRKTDVSCSTGMPGFLLTAFHQRCLLSEYSLHVTSFMCKLVDTASALTPKEQSLRQTPVEFSHNQYIN